MCIRDRSPENQKKLLRYSVQKNTVYFVPKQLVIEFVRMLQTQLYTAYTHSIAPVCVKGIFACAWRNVSLNIISNTPLPKHGNQITRH